MKPAKPAAGTTSNVAVLPVPGPGASGEPAETGVPASSGRESRPVSEEGHRGYFQPGDYIRRRVRDGWRG